MSHPNMPLAPFLFQKVLSDASQIFFIALKPMAIIFGLEALFETALVYAIDLIGASSLLKIVGHVVEAAIYICAFGAATRVLQNVGYGHAPNLRGAVDEATRKFTPLALVGLGASLATVIGLALSVVPGVWLMGLWAVIIPVVMIEDGGLSAFSRSAALTLGYRWQAAAVILAVLAPTTLATYVVLSIFEAVPFAANIGTTLMSGVATIGMGIIASSAMAAVTLSIYKRLIDLKEAPGPDNIVDIFN